MSSIVISCGSGKSRNVSTLKAILCHLALLMIIVSVVAYGAPATNRTSMNSIEEADFESSGEPDQQSLVNVETTTMVSTTTSATTTEIEEIVEPASFRNTSTFSCYGRQLGYYADVKLDCKVYHFCTQMDNFGETTYQRMSYVCLEDSVFDQGDLNCVKEAKMRVPCSEAEKFFDSSNKQFDSKDDNQPSMSDSLAASIMLNPITRFIAG